MSHDPEEGVRVCAPAATLFGLSALLLSISMASEPLSLREANLKFAHAWVNVGEKQ